MTSTSPRVTGVLETALYVEDLPLAIKFYQTIFYFDVLFSDHRMGALSVAGKQVLLLFKKGASLQPHQSTGGFIPPHDGAGNLHMAFSIATEDFADWERRLGENGVPIESKVKWELGGQSLYFRDPDNHAIELATPGTWAIY